MSGIARTPLNVYSVDFGVFCIGLLARNVGVWRRLIKWVLAIPDIGNSQKKRYPAFSPLISEHLRWIVAFVCKRLERISANQSNSTKSMVNAYSAWESYLHEPEKMKSSCSSFVQFRRSKCKTKKNLSSIFVEVSESSRIFRIVWVFPEIFGFENFKFLVSDPKSQNFQWAGSCSSDNQNRKTKKTYLGSSLNFQNLLEFLKSHE